MSLQIIKVAKDVKKGYLHFFSRIRVFVKKGLDHENLYEVLSE